MPALDRDARVAAFIAAAADRHAGQYDYTAVPAEYVNAHTKVTIGCEDHGTFQQAPNDHKRGQRCPDCSGRRGSSSDARREQFISRARAIHGDRYEYSSVVYIDQHTPVAIRCRLHGPFEQRPMNHLSSHTPSNCRDCADASRIGGLEAAWERRRPMPRDQETGQFKTV
ncbi:hypothetical protein [Curtobacterium sp. 458]|uniref:hypothetical protein n=1 Tax=Curtobacterium sp. 458 TaxID=3050069 RepID=UPI0025B2F923|nr:hypothetical protein [Curtobacterium sp. 458]WJY00850.1 hypothetical protein QPJ90_03915 [Curtobacterium sp. 458]